MDNKNLDRKIFQLATLPVFISGLILTILFISLHTYRVWDNSNQKFEFIRVLFSNTTNLSQEFNEHFDRTSNALLQTEGYLGTALFNSHRKLISQHGLPIPTDQVIDQLSQKEHWKIDGKNYISIPLNTGNGWAVVVTSQSNLTILLYQDILLLIVFTLSMSMLTIFLGKRLKNYIMKPVRSLQNGLKRLINGNFDAPIRTENQGIYKSLIRSINRLAVVQREALEDAQKATEQATSELQETLETVEIQNIEIDLARKNAVLANQQKSEFLANTSHEIRTPLNGIIGFTDLLKSTDLSPQQNEYLSTIEESAKSLLISINDIIDYSRLEVGKLNLDFKPVLIRQIVEEALQFSASLADEKNLRLISIVDKKIPKQLLGDPLRLKQVLANLISNAVHYATEGNIQINVSMENREDNQVTLKFKVTDTKTNLTRTQHKEINKLFETSDISEVHALDKGDMGLIIAKGLTDRMNGSIGLIFKENTGATFWFTATLGRTNLESLPQISDKALKHINAIIFDSDPVGRMEIEHLITSWDTKTTIAEHFSDIAPLARKVQESEYKPVVIIDTLITRNAFNKQQLEELINELGQSPSIPVIAITPAKLQHILAPLLPPHLCLSIQRPIISKVFFDLLCKQLGVIQDSLNYTDAFSEKHAIERESAPASILVVDDNPSNLKLVCELLKDLNAIVTTAESGGEAIEKFRDNEYTLIFMDIQMPGMDGFEATKNIRALEAERGNERTPIIALTAHAVEEEKSRLLLSGMDDFASKPVGEKELTELLRRWAKHNKAKTPRATQSSPQIKSSNHILIENTLPTPEKEDAEQASPKETQLEPAYTKVVDIAMSLQLSRNKADLAYDMLNMLIESLKDDYEQIQQLYTEKNWDTLQEIVHKIHGGSSYCGVPVLKQTSSVLDKNLKDEKLDNIESEFDLFIESVNELIEWSESHDLQSLFET